MDSDPIVHALRIQHEAARLGFDWTHTDELWAKLAEEVGELREAVTESQTRVLDEFGDLLFMAINLSRHLKVDPAQALAQANEKFNRRFGHVLAHRARWDALVSPARVEEMEKLWAEAKRLGL
ncbi:MAG: MazG nucleotide pyrophosphohydrolase domain-containing protein [Panacagrimonas sp.]